MSITKWLKNNISTFIHDAAITSYLLLTETVLPLYNKVNSLPLFNPDYFSIHRYY